MLTRLTLEEARELAHDFIVDLGERAHRRKLDLVGPRVFYSVNRHLNYTNVCRVGCRFCSFHRQPGQAGSYTLSLAQVLQKAQAAASAGADELHIVGGINPDLPWSFYLEMIESLHSAFPCVHLKAFTATEILDLAEKAGLSLDQVLGRLIDAGLGSLPGGGAEILDDGYFRQNCPQKPGPEKWLAVHAAAHRLGLMTTATMLLGQGETLEQRLGHLGKLRDLQDQSRAAGKGFFQCFVPLPYINSHASRVASGEPAHPNSEIQNLKSENADLQLSNTFMELRTIAISRLVLDNIPHVKAFWPMLGLKPAQIALAWGADDLDGTVGEYQVVEKKKETEAISEEMIQALIRETGQEPVKRINGIYS